MASHEDSRQHTTENKLCPTSLYLVPTLGLSIPTCLVLKSQLSIVYLQAQCRDANHSASRWEPLYPVEAKHKVQLPGCRSKAYLTGGYPVYGALPASTYLPHYSHAPGRRMLHNCVGVFIPPNDARLFRNTSEEFAMSI